MADKKTEKPTLHVENFSVELRQDFKALCSTQGLTMQEGITYVLAQAVRSKQKLGITAYRREKVK